MNRLDSFKILSRVHGERIVLIDETDFDFVSRYKWKLKFKGGHYHVEGRSSGTSEKLILLHRLLMNPEDNEVVDHINHDGLDNRRSNLRVCTRTQNNWNARKRKNGLSRFKGLRRDGTGWTVTICFNKQVIPLGWFESELEAAHRYDQAAQGLFGEFAHLNFTRAA